MIDNPRVDRGCGGVEGEDILRERAEHVYCCLLEHVLASAVREPLDAVEDLGHRDRRDSQLVVTVLRTFTVTDGQCRTVTDAQSPR
jgi:hypothetical protein